MDAPKATGNKDAAFEKFGDTRETLRAENCRLAVKVGQLQEENARLEDLLHRAAHAVNHSKELIMFLGYRYLDAVPGLTKQQLFKMLDDKLTEMDEAEEARRQPAAQLDPLAAMFGGRIPDSLNEMMKSGKVKIIGL